MSDNPYATPQSALEVSPENKSTFFVVSETKLAIMYVMTAGLYIFYWSYKNWKLYKASTSSSIWPIARGFFNIFFEYVLFQRINQCIERSGRSLIWLPRLRAVALIGLIVIRIWLNSFVDQLLGFALSLIVMCVVIYLLIGAQRAINYMEDDPRGERNARFTLVNYVWVFLGVCYWGLALYGASLFMEERGIL